MKNIHLFSLVICAVIGIVTSCVRKEEPDDCNSDKELASYELSQTAIDFFPYHGINTLYFKNVSDGKMLIINRYLGFEEDRDIKHTREPYCEVNNWGWNYVFHWYLSLHSKYASFSTPQYQDTIYYHFEYSVENSEMTTGTDICDIFSISGQVIYQNNITSTAWTKGLIKVTGSGGNVVNAGKWFSDYRILHDTTLAGRFFPTLYTTANHPINFNYYFTEANGIEVIYIDQQLYLLDHME